MPNDPEDLTLYPVPSSDAYVLARNAQDIDKTVNGGNTVVTTRNGRQIPSLEKIAFDLGAVTFKGDYSGATAYTVYDAVFDAGEVLSSPAAWYIATQGFASTDIASDVAAGDLVLWQGASKGDVVLKFDSVSDLQGQGFSNGQQVSVAGYHAGSTVGGGLFVWTTGRHNGGTFIDPNRAFPTDWTDQTQLEDWFADSGSDSTGFKRFFSGKPISSYFGGSGDAEVSKMIEVFASNRSIVIDGAPTYTADIEWNGFEHETLDLPYLVNSEVIAGGNLNARMAVANGYLYVCSYSNNTIQAFNLANPAKPELTNSWSTGSQPRHIDIVGRHALVCCHGSASIEVYDLSNPAAAGLVGTIPTGANPKMFTISGDELYVVCSGSNTLEKYTYLLPSENSGFTYNQVATVSVSSQPLCCSFNQEGLVAVSGLGTNNVDIVGSSTLNLISSFSVGGVGHATCVWVNKTQLLVTDSSNNQVHSLDYESLTSPVISASIDVVESPEQIQIVGNKAYTPSLTNVGITSSLSVIDISDAKNPFEYKQIDLSVAGGGFTAYHDGYLYVNGHFSPYNIDVVEIIKGQPSENKVNTFETLYARSIGVSDLSASTINTEELASDSATFTSLDLNSVYQKYRTSLSNTSITESDNVVRLGSGADAALPDPSLMAGKQITIVNVSTSVVSTVTNAYNGFSGNLQPTAAITLIAMDFAGGYQWDPVSSYGTIS